MKCENCPEESTFKVKNIRKDETLHYCDLHFWQFCVRMVDAYKKIGIAVKEIDKMLETIK